MSENQRRGEGQRCKLAARLLAITAAAAARCVAGRISAGCLPNSSSTGNIVEKFVLAVARRRERFNLGVGPRFRRFRGTAAAQLLFGGKMPAPLPACRSVEKQNLSLDC